MKYYGLNPAARCSIAAAALAAGLVACGGSGSSDGGSGSLSLGVTDAPIDSATAVFVEFSSVELKPANGSSFTIELDPAQSIDLLKQQNGESHLLIKDEEVPAGKYNWIRLGVNEGANATYIELSDGPHPLEVPSGQQTGLKLVSGFTVGNGGSLALTIDFDLRKSVVEAPTDDYKLRPALRLVNNDEVGEIAATATDNYISSNLCGSDATDSTQAVYVFEGRDVTPDDVDDRDAEPITTASLTYDDDKQLYTGTAAFLEPGTYTVAFTCNPENDEPPTADSDNSDDLTFLNVRNVEVERGETAEYKLEVTS